MKNSGPAQSPEPHTSPAPVLRPLEVAAGMVWGFDPTLTALEPDHSRTPRQALDEVMVEALSHSPCVVSFSGGRDSSAVLAVATESARRHGLPLPIPVTMHFPEEASADESDWQALVIEHLGLDDWVKIELRDELDVIGPLSEPLLRTHGLLAPFNSYFHAPVAARAAGGVVLTGVGGDELFTRSPWRRVNELRSGLSAPRPRDIARLAVAYGPKALRARAIGRQFESPRWLTADAAREVLRHLGDMGASEAIDWDRSIVDTWWRSRSRSLGHTALAVVGAAHGTSMQHPLQDTRFLASMATFGGRVGYANRTDAMRALFDDLLPPALLCRPSKAYFRRTFWGPISRSFAAEWDGQHVDHAIVRVERLREIWGEREPHPGSMLLLQSVWLATQDSLSVPGPSVAT
jgi:asparagine synthase (glutamine-hydrolysing)